MAPLVLRVNRPVLGLEVTDRIVQVGPEEFMLCRPLPRSMRWELIQAMEWGDLEEAPPRHPAPGHLRLVR